MKIGVVFPQTEIGSNPRDAAAFARAAEDLGYDHLLVYDHVLGVVPRGSSWLGYTHKDMFHEPFVLFGYLASVTQRGPASNPPRPTSRRSAGSVTPSVPRAQDDALRGSRGVPRVGLECVDAEGRRRDDQVRGDQLRVLEPVASPSCETNVTISVDTPTVATSEIAPA